MKPTIRTCFRLSKCRTIRRLLLVALLIGSTLSSGQRSADGHTGPSVTGQWQLSVRDSQRRVMPCRVHLYNAANEPIRPPESIFFRDHFVIDGEIAIELEAGVYRYEVERGHEFETLAGDIEIEADQATRTTLTLDRIANLAERGWYSGDLHIHRPMEHVELLMRADDLHIGPTITWWNARNPWQEIEPPTDLPIQFDGNRFIDVMAGEDEREGGALLFFHLNEPLEIQEAGREYPSPMVFVADAIRQNEDVWIDIEKPFWWDVPVWVASGDADSIGIANNHMCRRSVLGNEAWGRPRDLTRFPGPHGNGFWTQTIYYHILNCGIRLPPSAGSASGVLPNHVGFNRVYVHTGPDLTYEAWWEGLAAGRSFVTNGPLLLAEANGQMPGHVFRVAEDDSFAATVTLDITSNEPLSVMELISNGEVISTVELDGEKQATFTSEFVQRRSGWFLIRVMGESDETFRFASTAPFYVEFESDPQYISSSSAQFFLDWIDERMERVPDKLSDPAHLESIHQYHRAARRFWEQKLQDANAD